MENTQKMPSALLPTLARMVHFTPPQECKGEETLEQYAAIVTKINGDGTAELATFGPNSLYFQHSVPMSEAPTPGHFNWPPRV